jgi:hypothetical protein
MQHVPSHPIPTQPINRPPPPTEKRHIAGGVEYSLELCTAGGTGALASIFRMGLGSINRSSSTQMAQTFVDDRIRRVGGGGG